MTANAAPFPCTRLSLPMSWSSCNNQRGLSFYGYSTRELRESVISEAMRMACHQSSQQFLQSHVYQWLSIPMVCQDHQSVLKTAAVQAPSQTHDIESFRVRPQGGYSTPLGRMRSNSLTFPLGMHTPDPHLVQQCLVYWRCPLNTHLNKCAFSTGSLQSTRETMHTCFCEIS